MELQLINRCIFDVILEVEKSSRPLSILIKRDLEKTKKKKKTKQIKKLDSGQKIKKIKKTKRLEELRAVKEKKR